MVGKLYLIKRFFKERENCMVKTWVLWEELGRGCFDPPALVLGSQNLPSVLLDLETPKSPSKSPGSVQ